MKFSEVVHKILNDSASPMTPQNIREVIKSKYPEFYGTPSHRRNVDRGHYKDIDHALLAQIYILIGNSNIYVCDKTFKPMKVSLRVRTGEQKPAAKKRASHSQINLSSHGRVNKYENQIRNITENAEIFHQAYYQAEVFSGPSLYFHQRALETRYEPDSLDHLEYVYATLSSWGMHRMGKGGSKMQDFDKFRRSVEKLKKIILNAQLFDYHDMSDENWASLRFIFKNIQVMASRTSLVSNSKVMHHMMPNIIPPIDRRYTLQFLRGNTNIKNDLGYEWKLMKEIINDFFIPVAENSDFRLMADGWMERKWQYPWDTSILKIIDNLVIGVKK